MIDLAERFVVAGQRGVEQLVSGAEDGTAHRDVQPSWNDPSPGTRHEEAEQAGCADCRRVARDGAFETETTEQEAPRRGLKEERDEAGHGVEESEEAQRGARPSRSTRRLPP